MIIGPLFRHGLTIRLPDAILTHKKSDQVENSTYTERENRASKITCIPLAPGSATPLKLSAST
jgi:hypothetical protein